MGLKIVPKVKVTDKHSLAVIYTPGVAASCLKIKDDKNTSFDYTNRENTIGVFSFSYEKSLKRAEFLKASLNIDAIPFEVNSEDSKDIKFLIENLEPSFGGVDLSLIAENVANVDFEVKIPVLTTPVPNLKEFFLCVSKNVFMFDLNKLTGTLGEQSLTLRKNAGGVVEVELTKEKHVKPVGILTEGSAVLGLGNIGALAGMPVMEGKSVLFSSLGGISAVPICIKTQVPEEFIKVSSLIKNSFSAINLEDISAPSCFEIEERMQKESRIPVFHDDEHGTAIVVAAGLINALKIVNKDIDKIKIVISGAGAAGTAISKLLIEANAKNIIICNRNGAIEKDKHYTKQNQTELAQITNPNNEKGSLKEIIKNADVFIGVSAPNLLDENDIKNMAENAIVFALANPIPEIMPDIAEKAGAKVVATGRSDFKNQINNSLAFPGVFKGLLKYKKNKITQKMKFNCAKALAEVVPKDKLSKDFIIPDALDLKAVDAVAEAINID